MKNEKQQKPTNLIIHPEDQSTTFLSPIYSGVEHKTVLTKNADSSQFNQLLKTSERIFAMGHGCPSGLFNVGGLVKNKWLAIDKGDVEALKDKTNNVYIWCHANKFVEDNDLHGFYSGMFISEVGEAMFCGIKHPTQAMVDESNYAFSEIVGKYIHLPLQELYSKVIEEYGKVATTNPVAQYNVERLYVR